MDETLLWLIALGSGILGVLLLVIAGVATVYWRRGPRAASAGPSPRPPEEAETPPAPPPSPSGGGLWTWAKAGLFAVIHSVTVSLVLGGVTFFEDLVRASHEIQQTGSVTFPKQLLPESVTNPAIKRLSRPDSDEADWEVVSSD